MTTSTAAVFENTAPIMTIEARFLGPTNLKGSRIKCSAGIHHKSRTYGYDHAAMDAFDTAVAEYIERLKAEDSIELTFVCKTRTNTCRLYNFTIKKSS